MKISKTRYFLNFTIPYRGMNVINYIIVLYYRPRTKYVGIFT